MVSAKGKDKLSSQELGFVRVFRKTSHDIAELVRKSPGICPPTVESVSNPFY